MDKEFINFKVAEPFLKKLYGEQFSYFLSEDEMYEIADIFKFQPFHGIFRKDDQNDVELVGKIFIKSLTNTK